jgi:hypothetical protein
MQVFHIKGFSGLLLLVLGIIGTLLLVFLVPSIFMMVLWNALVFEGAKGPEIDLLQGFMLWGSVMILLKVTLNPEFQFQFENVKTPRDIDRKLSEMNAKVAEKEEAAAPAAIDETKQTLDS